MVSNIIKRLQDAWTDHPSLDLISAVIISIISIAMNASQWITVGDHLALYQTLAGIALGLLSLNSLAVTIVFTVTPATRIAKVMAGAGREIVRIVFVGLAGLTICTLGFAALVALNEHLSGDGRVALTTFFLSLTIFIGGRLLMLLYSLVILSI